MEKIKKYSLFSMFTLSVLVVFTLTLHLDFARAQDVVEDINPLGGFEFNVLLNGQSSSLSTTATAPFDVFSVGVVSMGNKTLTASLNMTSEQSGVWWIALAGIGGTKWADFTFGLAPLSGPSAQIDISESVGYAIAIGGVFSLTPVTEEEPIKYSITVTGN